MIFRMTVLLISSLVTPQKSEQIPDEFLVTGTRTNGSNRIQLRQVLVYIYKFTSNLRSIIETDNLK